MIKREDFHQQIDTVEPLVSVHVSMGQLDGSEGDCLLQVGEDGKFTPAYLDDDQVAQLIEALQRFRALPE